MNVVPECRPSATWLPHSIRPYESLWILLHKYLILNRPTQQDAEEVFTFASARSGSTYQRKPGSISFSSQCNLQRFAAILGESASHLQYCTAFPFKKAKDWLFDDPNRFCPECLGLGYHTILFAAHGMSRCPVHGLDLCTNCPRCNHPFPMWLSEYQLDQPGKCSCGYVFLADDFLTKASMPDQKLTVFQPLVEWLTACGGRIAIDVTKDEQQLPGKISQLLPHMHHWPALLETQPPSYLAFPSREQSVSSGSTSGIVTCEYHTGRRLVSESRKSSSSSEKPCHTALYKSIRRQLTKVVFGKRTASMFKLGCSGFLHTRSLPAAMFQDKESALALSFLLWRSRIECRSSIAKWLAPRYDRSIRRLAWASAALKAFDEELNSQIELVQIDEDDFANMSRGYATAAETAWLSQHVMAHGFLLLWHRAVACVDEWSCKGIPYYGQRWGENCRLASGTFLRTVEGAIALTLPMIVTGKPVPLWKTASKTQRVHQAINRRQQQWQTLIEELNHHPQVLAYSPEQGWSVQTAEVPDACAIPLDIKRRCLVLSGSKLQFILFKGKTGNFLGRVFEPPIQVSGHDPGEAIHCLKRAVRMHQQGRAAQCDTES